MRMKKVGKYRLNRDTSPSYRKHEVVVHAVPWRGTNGKKVVMAADQLELCVKWDEGRF